MKLRTRSASCQMSSYCCWVIGMTICLAPRGTCGEGVVRSRFTCRVFGRASILASPSVERSRMTKMPPAGYPAFLQYLQSVTGQEFSMSPLESYATIGPKLTSATGSLLSLSRSHPPLPCTAHRSSAIRHLPSGIRPPPSALRHAPSGICHLPSPIRHPPSDICHPPFRVPHSPFRIPPSAFSEGFRAFASARGAGPTGSAGAARTPGCNPRHRAVVPLVGLVGLDFLMLGQQLLGAGRRAAR